MANEPGGVSSGRVRQPGLLGMIVLATPALLYYPSLWVEAFARPPSPVWYWAQNLGWLFLFSPLSLAIMLYLWPQMSPAAKLQRALAAFVIAYTAWICLQVFGFLRIFV